MASLFKNIIILPIRLYQITISPLIGSNCRFKPTCSSYMIHAVEEWGALKGLWLGLKRIGRCHPWGPTDPFDPVPKKEEQKKKS